MCPTSPFRIFRYLITMNYSNQHSRIPGRLLALLLVSFAVLTGLPKSSASTSRADDPSPAQLIFGAPYRQTNLVSDLPGIALVEDRLLKAPWGVAASPTSPFW